MTLEDEEKFLEFEANYKEENIIPSSCNRHGKTFEEWLESENNFHDNAPKGLVNAHTFFTYNGNDEIVGAVNIRHELNEHLLNFGGHIGYGINPKFRKKGIGTVQCKLALEKAKELGIKKALITCNKTNTGSAKIIEANGGVLENERTDSHGDVFKRYWVDVK